MDIVNERTYELKIHKTNFPRFKPLEKDAKPGPTSYNAADALNNSSSMMNSSKYSMRKDPKIFL